MLETKAENKNNFIEIGHMGKHQIAAGAKLFYRDDMTQQEKQNIRKNFETLYYGNSYFLSANDFGKDLTGRKLIAFASIDIIDYAKSTAVLKIVWDEKIYGEPITIKLVKAFVGSISGNNYSKILVKVEDNLEHYIYEQAGFISFDADSIDYGQIKPEYLIATILSFSKNKFMEIKI